MRNFLVPITLVFGCLLARGADWLTDGGNPQRTAWQKDEKILTKANVKGMKLLWKIKLDNQPRQMHNLFPPLIASRVTTRSGPKQIAVVAGVSDNLYAIDVEKGEIIWRKRFQSSWTPPTGGRGGGVLCPGGLTATPVIAPTKTPGKYTVYVASWDGMLHQLNVADGEDLAPPAKWMPPNGKPYGLNLWNGVIYTTTAQGCGGNPNLVYAYDLATNKVGTFAPGSGGMWGRSGPTVGADGTVYAGTGDGDYDPANEIYGQAIIGVKQDPTTKALYLKDHYAPSNAVWLRKRDMDMNVTGVIFNFKGREILVNSSKECKIWVMDTKSLGGEGHRTPLIRTPLICNEEVNFAEAGIWGSMATWEDSRRTRWVLAPIWGPKHPDFKFPVSYGEVKRGAIVAFKLEDNSGKMELTPAWISRDMDQAEPPVVANGVVYAYGNGESSVQSTPELGLGANNAEMRIRNSTQAVIYALDALTGKELWSSEKQITSFVHFGGLSIANGRIYLGAFDGTLYCFGLGK